MRGLMGEGLALPAAVWRLAWVVGCTFPIPVALSLAMRRRRAKGMREGTRRALRARTLYSYACRALALACRGGAWQVGQLGERAAAEERAGDQGEAAIERVDTAREEGRPDPVTEPEAAS